MNRDNSRIILFSLLYILVTEIIYRTLLAFTDLYYLPIILTISFNAAIYIYTGYLLKYAHLIYLKILLAAFILSFFGHIMLGFAIFILPIFISNIPSNIDAFIGIIISFPFEFIIGTVLLLLGRWLSILNNARKKG